MDRCDEVPAQSTISIGKHSLSCNNPQPTWLGAVCHALSYRVATEKQHHNNLQSRMHLVEDSVYF